MARETESKEAREEAQEIDALLARYQAFITYVPLRGEVPFLDYISLPEGVQYAIAPRASLDPLEEVANAKRAVTDVPTALLIPGSAFDAAGTRHGRGGGWYDRFLAAAPTHWYRIGFCFARQFSDAPLVRASWDEPVDAVCVIENGVARLITTGARNI